MPRYFLEVAYKGTNYSGFQAQKNANSIQAELQRAILVLQKQEVILTGSSRTDAGVHALQNFFHFDLEGQMDPGFLYKVNSILPSDIVVQKLIPVGEGAHCRFDALSREYQYFIYAHKNPFLKDTAFYFPYRLNRELMDEAASLIKDYSDFTSFSKRKTQVKTFICHIQESKWYVDKGCLVFCVKADRFLRGMVRALVATMLRIGREKMTIDELKKIIEEKDCTKASFGVPSHGLFLVGVTYPEGYFQSW